MELIETSSIVENVNFATLKGKSDFELKTSGEPESILTQSSFYNRGFIAKENWAKSIHIQAKVIQFNKEKVTCECLVDREEQIFETRVFTRELFNHFEKLHEGKFVLIGIKSRAGASRIDIYDGAGTVDESLFEIKDGWDKLEGSNLGKMISFEND